jgi:large-conductance mechanosensitive channel
MDLQQILAFVLVAAAAAFLVVRIVRRRKRGTFRECADCPAVDAHAGAQAPDKK